MAATASTIVSELISRTNELTDVYGMSYRLAIVGPAFGVRSRYSRNVEMRPPNSRHSDPRNTHIASFSFERPVEVCSAVVGCAALVSSTVVALTWGRPSVVGK